MKYKKLIYSNDVMQDFNSFFDGKFKVKEVGIITTSYNMKDILLAKCPYDGLALNREDGTIYLKFCNTNNEEFILLEDKTIIIDDNELYQTCDIGINIISKGNIENEIKRLKDYKLTFKH